MLNEEFERWWQEAQHRLKAGVKVQQLCKEAYIYGVNVGFGAVMDSERREQLFQALTDDNT